MSKRAATFLLLATLWFAAIAVAYANCNVHQHQRVALYSGSDDPDVLVWDSRFRMREYHEATFDEARALVLHARLVPPGTRVVVENCVPDFVLSPLFDRPADAVGILIVSGPDSGQRGWVLSSDVRPR